MSRSFRPAAALLPALFSLAAHASPALPEAPAIQASMRRAIEAQIQAAKDDESGFPGEELILGRLLLIEIADVHGCMPLQDGRLNCIVSFDEGFGQIRYRPMLMEQREGQWEALPGDEDAPELAPTAAQAQEVMRSYAREQIARGAVDEQLIQIANGTGFLDPSLSDCRLNEEPFVTCDAEASWPSASGGTQVLGGRVGFRLVGTQWQLQD